MIVAAHQPDLLPYSGFWHKMALADVMVLLPHDQFQKHGYQRRVLMRGKWCSHRLVADPALRPIEEVRVHQGWQQHLVDVVAGRYRGSRHWADRGPALCDLVLSVDEGDRLSSVNTALIRIMADLLGIETPLVSSDPANTASGAERVLNHVLAVPGATAYLSGQGARAYMPDAQEKFAEAGIDLQWSAHCHASPDSILTAWFDEDEPMGAVLS